MAKKKTQGRVKKTTLNAKASSHPSNIEQKRFCRIYHSMKHPNQAQAYELAGFKSRGKAAEAHASRLVRNGRVKAYLEKLGKSAEARAEKTADEIIRELEGIGFEKLKKRGLVKASDKIKALEALGKRYSLFPNNVQHTGKDSEPLSMTVYVCTDKVQE